jgi:transposase
MQVVTTIGLDIAKSVFQVHGVDAAGQVLIRRQLKRRAVLAFFQKLPYVGIEACASSHYWSRELEKFAIDGAKKTFTTQSTHRRHLALCAALPQGLLRCGFHHLAGSSH